MSLPPPRIIPQLPVTSPSPTSPLSSSGNIQSTIMENINNNNSTHAHQHRHNHSNGSSTLPSPSSVSLLLTTSSSFSSLPPAISPSSAVSPSSPTPPLRVSPPQSISVSSSQPAASFASSVTTLPPINPLSSNPSSRKSSLTSLSSSSSSSSISSLRGVPKLLLPSSLSNPHGGDEDDDDFDSDGNPIITILQQTSATSTLSLPIPSSSPTLSTSTSTTSSPLPLPSPPALLPSHHTSTLSPSFPHPVPTHYPPHPSSQSAPTSPPQPHPKPHLTLNVSTSPSPPSSISPFIAIETVDFQNNTPLSMRHRRSASDVSMQVAVIAAANLATNSNGGSDSIPPSSSSSSSSSTSTSSATNQPKSSTNLNISVGNKLKLSLPALEITPSSPAPPIIFTSNSSTPMIMSDPNEIQMLPNNDTNSSPFSSSSSPLTSSLIPTSSLSSSFLSPSPPLDPTAISATSKSKKLAYYAQQCSQIEEFLYVAGKNIASNLNVLKQNNITRVLNCAGDVCENYFEGQGVEYLKFYLLDSASEDIVCVLYPAFEFLEETRRMGKRALVHCQQGVSRSTVMCIAYLMFIKNSDYDEMYQYVRAKRGVCRPNVGFMCQLLSWRKRLTGKSTRPFAMYRMAPHCSRDHTVLAKWVDRIDSSSLDDRAIFILQTTQCVFIWIGAQCHDSEIEYVLPIAQKQVSRLQSYEHAPMITHILRQKEERITMEKPLPGCEQIGIGNQDTPSPSQNTPRTPRSQSHSRSNALHVSSSMKFQRDESSAVGDRDDGFDSPRTPNGPSADDSPSAHFWYIVGGSPHTHFVNHSYDEDYSLLLTATTTIKGKTSAGGANTRWLLPMLSKPSTNGGDTDMADETSYPLKEVGLSTSSSSSSIAFSSSAASTPSSSSSSLSNSHHSFLPFHEKSSASSNPTISTFNSAPFHESSDSLSSSSSSPSRSRSPSLSFRKSRGRLRSMELPIDRSGPSDREIRVAAAITKQFQNGTSSPTLGGQSAPSPPLITITALPPPNNTSHSLNPIVESTTNTFSPINSSQTDKLNFHSPIHLSPENLNLNPNLRSRNSTLPAKLDPKSKLSDDPALVDMCNGKLIGNGMVHLEEEKKVSPLLHLNDFGNGNGTNRSTDIDSEMTMHNMNMNISHVPSSPQDMDISSEFLEEGPHGPGRTKGMSISPNTSFSSSSSFDDAEMRELEDEDLIDDE